MASLHAAGTVSPRQSVAWAIYAVAPHAMPVATAVRAPTTRHPSNHLANSVRVAHEVREWYQMGWLPSSPNGIVMCQENGVYNHCAERTATVTTTTMIGVDLAKNVFQLHAASMSGEVEYRKQLSRDKFRKFMAQQAPAVVVMEACGSANYWARELARLGHEVSPDYS
jgi:hypothetical protein